MIQPSNGKGTWMQYNRMIAAGARYNGTYIIGSKGSGKSTLEAELGWYDFLTNIGQIILDTIGLVQYIPFYGSSFAFYGILRFQRMPAT